VNDRHRETPVAVRFGEDRHELEDYARENGMAVHRVVRKAVRALLDMHRSRCEGSTETTETEAGR
jgi:hypothetical protein